MIPKDLRDRYSRQTVFEGIGEEGQAKLLASKAVIIGCGALGCNIASLLVRAGVGYVKIIDRDFPEFHNLQRQTLFDEDDVKNGVPKAIAAERYLIKVNSTVKVKGVVADINFTNVEELCRETDVILDGLDNFETRFLLNDVALKLKIPWIYGSALMSSGMSMNIIPGKTPCFRCLTSVPPDPASVPTCESAGVVGTVPAIIGAIQATEAIKILIGSREVSRELIIIDVWKTTFDRLKIKRRENCPACGGNYQFLNDRFDVKTTTLCGQSRAIQVIDTRVKAVSLARLAGGLTGGKIITRNRYLLRFTAGEYEISVFPDGRAIVKNTLEPATARELYEKYVRVSAVPT
ncbi:MAG: ThiF family adenylyltransferase [Dehalococcoidia bacterium]|nr:ThiF family adenylyltransferase [Dehalococcoidia bacterium]